MSSVIQLESGESHDTPVPPLGARVRTPASQWRLCSASGASGWPSFRPARCNGAHPAIRISGVWGAGKSCCYRMSALSWSLSNLVPNSCSIRSPISCQVFPAAFISLSTDKALLRDRSSSSILWPFLSRRACVTARRRLFASVSSFAPSFRFAIATLGRRGRSQ
jgi:hypothetical protein